ncbi:MAG: hypothetical protein QW279_11920, partial [Candidatus Jordarchaeaceae archaeon]
SGNPSPPSFPRKREPIPPRRSRASGNPLPVIPAKAGTHTHPSFPRNLSSRKWGAGTHSGNARTHSYFHPSLTNTQQKRTAERTQAHNPSKTQKTQPCKSPSRTQKNPNCRCSLELKSSAKNEEKTPNPPPNRSVFAQRAP